MDFQFTPEDEAFRLEVRDFLRRELPPDWVGIVNNDMLAADEFDIEVRMRKALAKQGWLTLAWPKEYGGAEASPMRQVIFTEEVSYALAPGRDSQGIGMVGPCLMVHGTEEQKRRHIPPIANGEAVWCQGYSEPGSGSDLASLQTRAERDGDDYVINGQKVWTSYAHRADWMHVLTRTDPEAPKHRGISYFMLDMKTPGIDIRPLINITGGHGFNEIYFDNVRVPAENMLGEENRGWYVATTTLDFERSSLNFAAALRRVLEEFVRYLKEARPSGAPSPADPVLRNKLADLFLSLRVGRNLGYRVAWLQSQGKTPNMEASLSKLYATEVYQKVARGLVPLLGLVGQLGMDDRRAPLAVSWRICTSTASARPSPAARRRSSATSSRRAGWACRGRPGRGAAGPPRQPLVVRRRHLPLPVLQESQGVWGRVECRVRWG